MFHYVHSLRSKALFVTYDSFDGKLNMCLCWESVMPCHGWKKGDAGYHIVIWCRNMASKNLVDIDSCNDLSPDGTRPLPEPMLTCHQQSPVPFTKGFASDIYPSYTSENCLFKITAALVRGQWPKSVICIINSWDFLISYHKLPLDRHCLSGIWSMIMVIQ